MNGETVNLTRQPTTVVVADKGESDMGNIYTWMYVALIIIILIAGYNLYYYWTTWPSGATMSGGQVLGVALNIILFFGAIIAIFGVWNKNISCQGSLPQWTTATVVRNPGGRQTRGKVSDAF